MIYNFWSLNFVLNFLFQADVNIFRIPLSSFIGDVVISMDERIQATPNETRNLLKVISVQSTPKLISSFMLQYSQNINLPSGYTVDFGVSDYSMGTFHFSGFHKSLFSFYFDWLNPPLESLILGNPHCHTVLFNSFLADLTMSGPMWIGNRKINENLLSNRNGSICFNKVVKDYWFGLVPLITQKVKFNV